MSNNDFIYHEEWGIFLRKTQTELSSIYKEKKIFRRTIWYFDAKIRDLSVTGVRFADNKKENIKEKWKFIANELLK